MGKKCQAVDNGSSSDQNSPGFTSSVSVNKTNKQNSGNADVSADAFVRSEVSSEIAQPPSKEKRKTPSEGTTKESSQVPYPHKQLKPDSSSSITNCAVVPLSSVTRSVESKKVFQGPECSITTKADLKLDLNEGMETNEPIPVVAKLGVPKGLPVKPLSFGGEHGWNRSGINSAFREKAPVSRGFNFDLNIAATMDPEVPSLPCNSGIDLNNDPIIEDAGKSIYPQGETRQLLSNCDIPGTRAPYWVDLSSVRGFGNVQSRPFLMGAPTTEQAQISQMVVPIQMPYTPPGLYIGKMNGFAPAFYPPNMLSPLYNQPGAGPHFSAYPRSVRLLESSQGLSLNPHPYPNTRQTIFPNGSIALMENGSRNHFFEQRLKPVDQAVCPPLSMTRREPDTGWVASQVTQSLL